MGKILLVMPPMMVKDNYANMDQFAPHMPSIGLSYIYAACEEIGWQVNFIDYQTKQIALEEIVESIKDNSYDIIGMQVYISNVQLCVDFAKLLKSNHVESTIILGGPHVTIFPDEVIKEDSIDYVCIGEGEETIKELCLCLENSRDPVDVAGIYYKKDGKIIKNRKREFIKDLDNLPFPKYEMFKFNDYYPGVHIRGKRVFNLLTARGCPYKCTFCAATKVWGNRFRFKSVDRVIKEMRFLKQNYSVDGLQIYDDNFTTIKKRVKELCSRMIKEEFNFQWVCYTRADAIGDKEMLKIMKQAGCYMIVVGIENGNDRILKLINKKLDLNVAKQNIDLARKEGINVLSSFMIGLPSETEQEIENTIKYALSIKLTYAMFPIFTPYPGTPIIEDAKKYGQIASNDLSEFSRWGDGVYTSSGLSTIDYKRLQRKAFKQFYIRFQTIIIVTLELLKLPPDRMLKFIKGGFLFLIKK